MTFQAELINNRRDVFTTSPKVLLLNIYGPEGLFRDHCWVCITPELEALIPKRNGKRLNIEFEAKVRSYQTYGPAKERLTSLRTIRVLVPPNR